MSRPCIREVIVVEGRHDSERLKKYFNCDTIETNGTHLGRQVLDLIKQAQKSRGVIVFTDPDSPGNRIRHAVNQAVPGCKNAYVQKEEARTAKKVGVEHAEQQVLEEALGHLVTYEKDAAARITMQDLYELGLGGKADSASLRKEACKALHIGFGNAKTFCQRVNCLGLSKDALEEIIHGKQ